MRSLGHRGDGIAQFDNQVFYVPFAVPGDRVLVSRSLDGTLKVEEHRPVSPLRVELLHASIFPAAVVAPFNSCKKDDYNQWKKSIICKCAEET